MQRTQSLFPVLRGLSRVMLAAAALSCATPAGEVHARSVPAPGRFDGLYQLEVLVDGAPAPSFFHAGERHVLGQIGRRYTLRVWNRSGRRIEAVVSVDGRDVIDGKPADHRDKRGYLVPAWGSVDIDGWRLSAHQAAAFRFTSVADSYAGRLGSPRNVGVIGVAVFPELERRQIAPPVHPEPFRSRAYPADDARGGRGSASDEGASESAPPAAAPAAEGPQARRQSESRRPGLGTEFGESVSSSVHEVPFLRANGRRPEAVVVLRYNDRRGLLALGIDVDGRQGYAGDDTWLRQTAEPFPVSQRRYASPPPGWRR